MNESSLVEALEAAIAENNKRTDPYDATALLENNGLNKAIAVVRQHESVLQRVEGES